MSGLIDVYKRQEQNSQSLYSASLIKVFVMAQTYANMDAVLQNEAAKMKKDVTDPSVSTKVNDMSLIHISRSF